jgi:hopanoid biosynthesis associated radical SAM protein HpnJ
MSTLFLCPPGIEGFDGGAGARYQARREVTSFWYPTWLAQAAALVPDSRLLDCPPHGLGREACLAEAARHDQVIIHTSTPSLLHDVDVAEAIKQQRPETRIGFVGAHAATLPRETLDASRAIDWVGHREFDFTCREAAEGRALDTIAGLSYRTPDGRLVRNPPRELIADMDVLPWVADVYRRDLDIRRYAIGYLLHPYLSLYTGRGCPAQCTFCLWPQTIGGHRYRVRSPQNVADEMAYMKRLFPEVREFFFDDDTFTANLPRARAIADRIRGLALTWSCNSRANLNEETLRHLHDCGLRLLLVGYESGNDQILRNIKKGVSTDQMRAFTRACHRVGVIIHGTFILGLPVETPETIEQTIRFAQELDVFSIQVSLAAPYPGTELYAQARSNGWFARPDTIQGGGYQTAALAYPGLSPEAIFDAVERFYHRWYFRPKPILRILRTMLADRRVCVRRLREGYEFFRNMRRRSTDPVDPHP